MCGPDAGGRISTEHLEAMCRENGQVRENFNGLNSYGLWKDTNVIWLSTMQCLAYHWKVGKIWIFWKNIQFGVQMSKWHLFTAIIVLCKDPPCWPPSWPRGHHWSQQHRPLLQALAAASSSWVQFFFSCENSFFRAPCRRGKYSSVGWNDYGKNGHFEQKIVEKEFNF